MNSILVEFIRIIVPHNDYRGTKLFLNETNSTMTERIFSAGESMKEIVLPLTILDQVIFCSADFVHQNSTFTKETVGTDGEKEVDFCNL